MKTIIHVNQHNIKHNIKNPNKKKVITAKTYKENIYTNELDIVDDNGKVIAKVIYSFDKPLPCGARLWIEANSNNVQIKEK